MAHHTESTTKGEAANAVVKSVIPFYERARVPTLAPQEVSEEIEKLLLELKSLMKINVRSRETKSNKKISEFKMKLETIMKFWPRNALEVMTNENNKSFLRSMIADRKASMGARDDITSSTEAKIARRKRDEERRQEKEKMRKKDACLVAEFHDAFNGHEVDGNYDGNDELEAKINNPTFIRSHERVVTT